MMGATSVHQQSATETTLKTEYIAGNTVLTIQQSDRKRSRS